MRRASPREMRPSTSGRKLDQAITRIDFTGVASAIPEHCIAWANRAAGELPVEWRVHPLDTCELRRCRPGAAANMAMA